MQVAIHPQFQHSDSDSSYLLLRWGIPRSRCLSGQTAFVQSLHQVSHYLHFPHELLKSSHKSKLLFGVTYYTDGSPLGSRLVYASNSNMGFLARHECQTEIVPAQMTDSRVGVSTASRYLCKAASPKLPQKISNAIRH